MKKLKLLLDVDETVLFPGFLRYVNEFLGTNYQYDDFTTYYIDEAAIPSEKMDEFNEFIRTKNLYDDPVFLPGAVESIKRLSEYYDILFCTDCRNPFDLASSGRIFMDKFNILFETFPQELIPAKNYILTGTKNIFKADVQVDDLLSNLDPAIEGRFLFPSYHNRNVTSEELKDKGIIKAGEDWKTGWSVLEQQLIAYYNSLNDDVKKMI